MARATSSQPQPTAEAPVAVEVEVMSSGALAQIDVASATEITAAIDNARAHPRNLGRSLDALKSMVGINRSTAESCFYSLKRYDKDAGGMKVIRGRSIRFAEIVATSWGHIRWGSRVVGETPDGRFVRVMGFAHDLQSNNLKVVEVQRRISTKEGRRYSDDMIVVTTNAAGAIAARNAVLAIVPEALTEEAYEHALAVAIGDATTLSERRMSAIAKLVKMNPLITPERILLSLEKKSVEEISLDDLAHLFGVYNSIRDGQPIDEAFPLPPSETPSGPAKSKLDTVAEAAKGAV